MSEPDLEALHDDIAAREDDTTRREAFEQAVTDDTGADETPAEASQRAGHVGDPHTAGDGPPDPERHT